jgi:hypothetical protein
MFFKREVRGNNINNSSAALQKTLRSHYREDSIKVVLEILDSLFLESYKALEYSYTLWEKIRVLPI